MDTMTNSELIPRIKSATLGIGLMNMKNIIPQVIAGSGFVVDKEGFILTAGHVIRNCVKQQKKLKENGLETKVAVFGFLSEGNVTDMVYTPFDKIAFLNFKPTQLEQNSIDVDVAIGVLTDRVIFSSYGFTSLKIEQERKLSVFDEIFMCGYPGGVGSLQITPDVMSMKMSPLLQYGHISGFMPNDTIKFPQLMQTDIIGTGGSSGSPIIDANNGHVVGIAQAVIASNVFVRTKQEWAFGSSNIGLVYGVTHNILHDIPKAIGEMKKGNFNVKNLQMKFSGTPTIEFIIPPKNQG